MFERTFDFFATGHPPTRPRLISSLPRCDRWRHHEIDVPITDFELRKAADRSRFRPMTRKRFDTSRFRPIDLSRGGQRRCRGLLGLGGREASPGRPLSTPRRAPRARRGERGELLTTRLARHEGRHNVQCDGPNRRADGVTLKGTVWARMLGTTESTIRQSYTSLSKSDETGDVPANDRIIRTRCSSPISPSTV